MIKFPMAGHAFSSLSEYVLCWVIDLFRISLFTLLGLWRQQTKPLVSNVTFFTTSQRSFLFIYHKTRPVYPISPHHQASLGSAGHLCLLTKRGNAREVSLLCPAPRTSHDGHPHIGWWPGPAPGAPRLWLTLDTRPLVCGQHWRPQQVSEWDIVRTGGSLPTLPSQMITSLLPRAWHSHTLVWTDAEQVTFHYFCQYSKQYDKLDSVINWVIWWL